MSLNKNKKHLYFIFFLSCMLTAQEKKAELDSIINTEELEQVIITATRTKKLVKNVALPVQIINKKEIQQINSMRLGEVLEEQTGLITVPDYGAAAGIQMQGLDAQYTLILLNGVPLIGRSAGTLDINRVTVGNIEKIEIVKGASSSLYGNDALGGVINIITQQPKSGFSTQLHYRGDSFNNHDISSQFGVKKNKLSISAFINRFQNAGYDLNPSDAIKTIDPFTNYTFQTGINYRFNNTVQLNITSRVFQQRQNAAPVENLAGEENSDEWNNHFLLHHCITPSLKTTAEFYISNYKTNSYLKNTQTNVLDSESYFDQYMIRPEYRVVYQTKFNAEIVAGLGWTYETLDRTYFSEKAIFSAPYALFQYDQNLGEKLNVVLGARFDNHNKYQSQFSPKLAINYNINKKISIKGSVGYGFKAPDFRQLYFDFTNNAIGYTVVGYNMVRTVVNRLQNQNQIANLLVPLSTFDSKLKAESSIGTNIGVHFKPSTRFTFSINAFQNNIQNLIDTRAIANKTNTQNIFSYVNIDKVYTRGIEVNASANIIKHIKIKGGYQYLIAKDKSVAAAFKNGDVYARNRQGSSFQLKPSDYVGLFNRSKHMANLKLFYNNPAWGLDANIRTTYRSKYALTDSNDNAYLDKYDAFINGYAVADVAINKTIAKHYTLGIGIDNLFNFTDPQNINNIPGRILYGKLNIKF
ncbi:TonB-dependent receptor plug domain-containing protein [Wenyingzhuangia sp. IMCC45467]